MLRRGLAWRAGLQKSLLARGCSSLVVSSALVLSAACKEDAAPNVDAAIMANGADAGVHGAADTGADARVPDAKNAAMDAGPPVTQRFAAATAELTALEAFAPDGGVFPLAATANWRTTSEGVDLDLTLTGCVAGVPYAFSILDARGKGGCAQVASSEMASDLGQGLPQLHCFGAGGRAATGYSRSAAGKAPWTIGGGSAADLVGQVLVVRDGPLGKLLACGAITRSADVERAPLPPVDQAPSIAARATIGGVCLGRQYAGSNPSCPDNAALLRCEAVHCEIGRCLESCESYASCLDQQADGCAATTRCEVSAECGLCMSQLSLCSKTFCGEDAFCAASPTPDGPCHRLANCGALQGTAEDDGLIVVVPLVAALGGDANCIGSMNDWAVVSSLKVPCLYGPEPPATVMPPPAQEPASGGLLADGLAGAACKADAECPGGRCAPVAMQPATASTAASGYCTTACDTASDCGHGGSCATSQSSAGKECLAECNEQTDCRPGFVCTGRLQGTAIVLAGACHPLRQPDQLADHVAGRACQVDENCSGGTCSTTNLLGTTYPGNYCTARCYEDAQCGQGGVCLWTRNSDDLGYCLASCNADADCAREDYGCWAMTDGTRLLHACYPLKRPLPDGRTGQPCTVDADCGAPGASCEKRLPYVGLVTNELVDVPGGYCTQHCSLDRECGKGAQCINYGTSGGLCLATCTSDATCRAGYACFPHSRASDTTAAVCVAPSP